ncbi:MAG: ATP-binding protein, partial [Candidatus Thiodiazotropha taylori]|nr:ATP-binding protein [Candidatus Thiodiazotropha taylori]
MAHRGVLFLDELP